MADTTVAPVTTQQPAAAPKAPIEATPASVKAAEVKGPETNGNVGQATPTPEQGKKLYAIA